MLTGRQREVLAALERFTTQSGYPPTLRELARILGISGISAVKKHLDVLADKGYLVRDRRARSITIRQPRAVSIPVLGRVAAGRPILAEENLDGALAIDRSAIRGGTHFFLRVNGESMNGAGILDGDFVLVRVQPQAQDGELVVALLEDEAVVKRLKRISSGVALLSENPDFKPIRPNQTDGFRILGRVTGLVRLSGR